MTKLLIEDGADLNAIDKFGRTPLLSAIDHPEVALMLLYSGADPNLPRSGASRPLDLAVSDGNVRLVEALLKAGADPTWKNDSGKTALDEAMLLKDESMRARLEIMLKSAGARERSIAQPK